MLQSLVRPKRQTLVIVSATVVVLFTVVCIVWMYISAQKGKSDYFKALPNSAKHYYAAQLALFGMPSTNVAVMNCSQVVGYANYSAQICCGLSANLQYPTQSDAGQLK